MHNRSHKKTNRTPYNSLFVQGATFDANKRLNNVAKFFAGIVADSVNAKRRGGKNG